MTPDPNRAEPGNVLVYFSPACLHCHHVLGYLDANQVTYEARDVTKIPNAREELKSLTGKLSIPVTVIGEQVIEGFDQRRLRELTGIPPGQERPAITVAAQEPEVDVPRLRAAVGDAKQLLRDNCAQGRTRASQHLYPHQWNWDAGFIARGYLHFDPEQAYREIRLLFEGQWSDGFLPHIVFNESYLEHFPGPAYWKADRSDRVPAGMHTSGISQPAVHASMLAAAPELDPDRARALAFLEEMYPRLNALHEFFLQHRDPAAEGLVCLVHPWESGVDNAPMWDAPLADINESSPWAQEMQGQYDALAEQGERPKRSYIGKYSYLVESLFRRAYDWKAITVDHPFLIQDVLFNAVLCQAERDLAAIAEAIGKNGRVHRERAAAISRAVNAKLWDEEDGLFYDFDMVAGRLIKQDTIFSYLPLYAGMCDGDRARRLMGNLRSHCFCIADKKNCVGIPSYDMCAADYEGDFYWRGPIWYNMSWYMFHGFRRYGDREQADWLQDSMLQLAAEQGFYEYYEPETGKGLGADGFSWTAALFIDLASHYLARRAR